MSNKFKRHIVSIVSITVAALSLLFAFTVWAATGTTDSSAVPGSTSSYTLNDIYNRLNAGTAGSQSTFTEPSVAPGTGTMYTLDAIMGAAPAVDAANGATAADVSSGKTAWGLTSGAWGVITGTGTIATYAAAVPETGDTYTDGSVTGEDGELLKGVAWPNPRFTDNSNGTVTDNLTGLIWLKNANCFSTSTWAQALTDANTLNSGECSLTDSSVEGDWRLPNVREMQSLVHYGVYNPTVPNTAGTAKWSAGDPFNNVQSYYYWSSTTFANGTGNAWYVYLSNGLVYYFGKTNTVYVWPVRGGQ